MSRKRSPICSITIGAAGTNRFGYTGIDLIVMDNGLAVNIHAVLRPIAETMKRVCSRKDRRDGFADSSRLNLIEAMVIVD
jgi:hypothetical protein